MALQTVQSPARRLGTGHLALVHEVISLAGRGDHSGPSPYIAYQHLHARGTMSGTQNVFSAIGPWSRDVYS